MMHREVGEFLPFSELAGEQFTRQDREFICGIMRFDWRDRPTAKELLEDEWWSQREQEVCDFTPMLMLRWDTDAAQALPIPGSPVPDLLQIC